MHNFRKNIGQMVWLLVVLFVALGAWFVWSANGDFIANPFNARVNMEGIGQRGAIYDRHGAVLAYTDEYGRNYPHAGALAHVVGYSGMSRAGLELSRTFTLERLSRELIQLAGAVVFDDDVVGNSLVTTLDAGVQDVIYRGLAGSRGAAVVVNVRDGAVVAMVSTPSFDPNTVHDDWGALLGMGDSPLLNRASQGLYPPGSTFKLITALAALEYDFTLLDYVMYCTGHMTFEGESLQCFGGHAHGSVDFMRAMAVSCNAYFARLAQMTDPLQITRTAQRAGLFNSAIPFELPASTPQFPFPAEPDTAELIQTAIGQGRTLATPLNMALLTAAIANDGVMMEPFLVERTVGAFDNTVSRHSPRRVGRVMDAEFARILQESMALVVAEGTGRPAARPELFVAGKTGTAQNETGVDHSWFVGFAPSCEPRYAVAIIIENTGGGTRATALAGEILEKALR